jgi:signal transduction histidine kinase
VLAAAVIEAPDVVHAGLTAPLLAAGLLAGGGAAVWLVLQWAAAKKRRAHLRHRVRTMRSRYRTLESILSVSARINATRDLRELRDKVAAAVVEAIGFGGVVLYTWSETTRVFQAVSFAGLAPREQASLAGHQISQEDFDALTSAASRTSNCYLIGADPESSVADKTDHDPDDAARGGGRSWGHGMQLIAPLIDQSGANIGFLRLERPAAGCIPSLVEIHQLEFLLKQSATAMESARVYDNLARRNADLAHVSDRMNSLTDMKNNFVANVSHELRTPLTSIAAYTELLQKNLTTLSPQSLEEFLQVIHNESVKLSDIITDILELSQMEKGRPGMNQVATDLAGMVRHLGGSWKTRAKERDTEFQTDLGSAEIVLPLDPMLMQQMLTHLVGNAFKFTPAGGRVIVSVREEVTAVRITVEDNGIGIPPDKLDEIFDSFYQVDGSSTRRHNGQGVGLAICRDIVVHHDGRIWAENVAPRGTRFHVLLPRRPVVLQPGDPQKLTGLPFEAGEFMQRLMHWVSESLGVQLATLMVPDQDGEFLTIRAAIGLPEAVVQSARLRRGAGFAGKVWATGETLLIDDLEVEGDADLETNDLRYSTPSLLAVPLLNAGTLVGVITVNNKIDGRPLGDDDRVFLESLVPRITALLTRYEAWQDGARHFEAVRNTLRATTAVGRARHESILAVCQEICLATARSIDLPADDLARLAFCLQFYDVGLDRVSPQIINKPGPLDDAERRFVQEHVGHTLGILEPLLLEAKAKQLILHHHENFDGSGYPAGLAGETIPPGARLVRLADTLASLLSPRPWRDAMSLAEALEAIRRGVGVEFCPRMAPVFLDEAERRRERILALQAIEESVRMRGAGHEEVPPLPVMS